MKGDFAIVTVLKEDFYLLFHRLFGLPRQFTWPGLSRALGLL